MPDATAPRSLRVQLRTELIPFVERDGIASATLHGRTPPEPGAESGDRIISHVPLPYDAVIVTGGSLPAKGELAVQGVHWRSRGWAYAAHRVVALMTPDRFGVVVLASPWAPGAWEGDAVLRSDFDNGLPPEASA